MDRTGTVTCPCGCAHRFTVRWPEAPAPAPAPTPLPTPTALAALRSRAELDPKNPADLAARIAVWLARRVGARSVAVRTIYHAMHCSAEECYAALRLLVRNGDVMIFTGPPALVRLRTAPGTSGARPSAPAGAGSSAASATSGTAPTCAPASRAPEV